MNDSIEPVALQGPGTQNARPVSLSLCKVNAKDGKRNKNYEKRNIGSTK